LYILLIYGHVGGSFCLGKRRDKIATFYCKLEINLFRAMQLVVERGISCIEVTKARIATYGVLIMFSLETLNARKQAQTPVHPSASVAGNFN